MDGGQKGEASVRRSLLVWLSLTSLFPRDLSPMRSSPSTDFKKVGSLLFINLRASHPSHPLVFPGAPRKESRQNSAGIGPARRTGLLVLTQVRGYHLLQNLTNARGPLKAEQKPSQRSRMELA